MISELTLISSERNFLLETAEIQPLFPWSVFVCMHWDWKGKNPKTLNLQIQNVHATELSCSVCWMDLARNQSWKYHPITFKAIDSVVAIISFWIYKEKKMVWFFISPFQWIEAHLCSRCGVSEPNTRCSLSVSASDLVTGWWEMRSPIANIHTCISVWVSSCSVLIYSSFQELDQLKRGRDTSQHLSLLNAWR